MTAFFVVPGAIVLSLVLSVVFVMAMGYVLEELGIRRASRRTQRDVGRAAESDRILAAQAARATEAREDEDLRRKTLRSLTPEDRALLDDWGWKPPTWMANEEALQVAADAYTAAVQSGDSFAIEMAALRWNHQNAVTYHWSEARAARHA